ncbi:MAG: hypothetical protein KUL86_10775 [Castellaniella sp.]|nr:hypothetical protein [Castellaniella sp.]
MKHTIIIGGPHHGQPIELTDPPMPSLVMLDDPKNTGYMLVRLRGPNAETKLLESRAFYVADGVTADEATALALPHWESGALL